MDPHPIREPPELPPDEPPKPQQPPTAPPSDPTPATSASQAVPIPSAYGTNKLPVFVLEKQVPSQSVPPVWPASSAVGVGFIVSNNGNAYQCIFPGVTAGSGGPAGTGASINDGSALWKYLQQLPYPIYYQFFIGGLCEGQIANALKVWWDKETFPVLAFPVVGKGGALTMTTGPDAANQTVPAAWDQCGYQHVALLYSSSGTGAQSGSQKEIPAIAVETQAVMFPGGGPSAPGILTAVGSNSGGSLAAAKYFVRVTALNASGESLSSFELSFSVTIGPSGSGAITWSAVGGATSYRVYWGTSPSGENVFNAPGNVTSFTITGSSTSPGFPPDDVNPADIVNDLLTHARRGVNWPSSRVGTSITGTAAGDYRVYCDAAGLRISLTLDQQRTALDWINDILLATNSEGVWSGGALKIVPLGDQPIASPVYGATGYVPTTAAIYALTLDDFLDQDFPIQVSHRDDADCFNTYPIEFIDRSQSYARTTVEDPEQLDVDARGGKRTAQTIRLPMTFADGTRVTMLSRILAQRSIYARNTYTFRLPYWAMLLEPGDTVTLPAEVLGEVRPVRITSMREDPNQGFTFTADDFPVAAQAAIAYAPPVTNGYQENLPGTVATAPIMTGVLPTGDVNITIGPYQFSTAFFRILRMLDGDSITMGGNGIGWYRGNIDPTDGNSGIPIIWAGSVSRLTINNWTSGLVAYRLPAANDFAFVFRGKFTLQPQANSDNLDAIRYMRVIFFDSAGTAQGDTAQIPFGDRLYKVPGTVTNAGNAYIYQGPIFNMGSTNMIYGVAPFCFNGYLRVALFNAYGQSAELDFGPNGNTSNGAAMAPNTSPPSGGGGGASGGGGSGYCPTPDARILLASGDTIRAGDLIDGMEVLGFKERDFANPIVGKTRYVSHELARMLYALKLADGRVMRFSENHRLCSVKRGWTMIQDLKQYEQLVAQKESIVSEVMRDGPGGVVGFIVEGPHTYFADDVLCHNTKPSVP